MRALSSELLIGADELSSELLIGAANLSSKLLIGADGAALGRRMFKCLCILCPAERIHGILILTFMKIGGVLIL